MFVVVSYDVKSDRRRNRVHKALKAYGEWMQFSVFECDLTEAQYLKLRHRLDELIDRDIDSIRFYFLCEGCQPKVERIGGPVPVGDGPVFV